MNLEDDSNNDEDLIVENFSMDRKPPAKVINVEKVKCDLIDENISMDTSDDVYESTSSIELDKSSKDGSDDVNVKDNSSLSWYEKLRLANMKRNKEKLESLGLLHNMSAAPSTNINKKKNKTKSIESLPVPHKKSSQTCAQKPKTL